MMSARPLGHSRTRSPPASWSEWDNWANPALVRVLHRSPRTPAQPLSSGPQGTDNPAAPDPRDRAFAVKIRPVRASLAACPRLRIQSAERPPFRILQRRGPVRI
jgi:hypothetical protein